MPAKEAAKAMSCRTRTSMSGLDRKRRSNVESVLVIHDNSGSQPTVSWILERAGYNVTIIGFDQIETNVFSTTNAKLVILDVSLPGKAQWDVCRQIRETSKNASILVLSSIHEVEEVIQFLKVGADDYITKPFNQLEFLARIRAAMGHHVNR